MSELRLFIPIGKIDEAQRLVYGTLTEETPDKSGEMFDYASGKPAVQAWSDEISAASKGKSKGNVRAMHGPSAAGKFTDIVYDDANKRIEGAAKIIDDAEWAKVLEGVYTGFSIGGSYTKRWQDKDNPSLWRFTPKLSEISLVDNPCVPTATFEYIKADGSVEMRKFTPSHHEESMDPKALAAAKEALAKGTATDEHKALLKAEADALLKAAQDAELAGTATDEQKAILKAAADAAKPELVKDGKAVKPKAAPVQKNVWLASDDTEHASKREAEIYNLHLEKQAELAPGLAVMDALLKGSKPKDDKDEDADGDDGDDEDTKKAKKARRDEKAAKAKEKAEKDDAEMTAKAKKDKDDAEKAAAAADLAKTAPALLAKKLKKGLGQIGWLANLLSELQCLQGSVEFEQMWEGDTGSELPEKFKGLVSEMCEVLVALVDEETKELIAGDDTDIEILAMAAKMSGDHAAALAKRIGGMPADVFGDKAVQAVGLKKALEKAGARHSKADMDAFADMHKMVKDHADAMSKMADDHCDAMGKCMKDAGMIADDGEDDMEPSDSKGAKKMSKLYEELNAKTDEVLAVSKVAASSNETLLKAIPLIEGLQKQIGILEKEKLDLAKRMDHLEKQPAAPKGHVRAVSKTQDGGQTEQVETEAEYKARVEKMTPGQKAREAMIKSMANPMALQNL